MADILASLSVKLGADVSEFQRALATAKKDLAGFVKAGEQLKGIGESLLPLSAGILAFGGYAVKVAGDFESAFNRVEAATQASGAELQALKDKAQNIALDPKLKFSATQAAGALENLAKNGLSTADILGGAADASVNLATATGGTLAKAADITTDVLANFGKTAGELSAVVDGITGATVASKFGIDDYQQALAQAGAVAGQLGVRFEDFNTALAVTSSGFSSGSDAGTSFKTFLSRLNPASKEAADAMKKLGLRFFDAQGQMKPLREIAGELQKAFKGLSDQQRNELGTKIFGSDSIRTALLLAKQGTEGFDKMAESIGKVDAASQGAILSKGFNGSLEALGSAFSQFQIRLGESGLLELGSKLLGMATEAINALSGLSPEVLRVGSVFAAAAASVGPLALAVGTFTSTVLPALRVGFLALTGPVGIAIAAIAVGAYLIIDNWTEIVDYFKGPAGDVFRELQRTVVESIDNIKKAFVGINKIGEDWVTLGDLLIGVVKIVAKELATGIASILDLVNGLVRTVTSLLNRDWAQAWDGAKQAVLGLFGPLANLLGLDYSKFRDFLGIVGDKPKGTGYSEYFLALTNNALGAEQAIGEVVITAERLGAIKPPDLLTDEQIKALEKLAEALRVNGQLSVLLGEDYDFIGQRQSIIESGLKSLIEAGFNPASSAVQRYRKELGLLDSILRGADKPMQISAPKTIGDTNGTAVASKFIADYQAAFKTLEQQTLYLPVPVTGQFVAPLQEASEQMRLFQLTAETFTAGLASTLQGGLTNVAVGVGEAIGQIMLNAGGIELVGAALLSGIGSLAIDLGKLAIATGIAVSGIKAALETLNPVVAIGAGIALVALGSAVKGAASKIGGGGGGSLPKAPSAPSASAYRAPSPTSANGPTAATVQNNTTVLQLMVNSGAILQELEIKQTRDGRILGVSQR